MPEYLSPGVYVEEVSSGIKPIEGVGTSTGAFVGRARKGPINKPQLVTNPTQFTTIFGGLHQDYLLGYGVVNFFGEGGTRCYVVRVFNPSSAEPNSDRARLALNDALTVLALNEGEWGNSIYVKVTAPAFDANDPDNEDGKFGLRVFYVRAGEERFADDDTEAETKEKEEKYLVEVFDRLSMNTLTDGLPNPYHVENQINGKSSYIEVDVGDGDAPDVGAVPQPLAEGAEGAALDAPTDYTGVPGDEEGLKGLQAFDTIDDINIVAIPDLFNSALTPQEARIATEAGMNYCEKRKDCFFVADCPPGNDPTRGLSATQVLEYKEARGDFATDAGKAFNSTYGALYYPWVRIFDPLRGRAISFPPSASIAGVYSATDISRGVHKAPAGVVEGRLKTVVGIQRDITKGEQDTLNPKGINVIRNFPEAGIVVWGARTVSADPEWRYVNVRRLFLFLEESIDEGTQWVVFEPNDPTLWARIRRNISAFLRIQWLEGKLVGLKEEDAFFVKCDEETNPPESVDLGRVITIIGVAPSKPAEFVIFRIMQKRPGADA